MTENIIELLCEMGIEKFKVVKHTINQALCTYIRESLPEKFMKKIALYKVFFCEENHIYRIDFTYDDCDELKDSICKMLAQKQWYCDYSENFFEDNQTIMMPCSEISCLEPSLLQNLLATYKNITQLQYLFTEIEIERSTLRSSCKQIRNESTLSLKIKLGSNFPEHEIVVYNGKKIDDISDEINRQLKLIFSQTSIAASSPTVCLSKKILLSPDIAKTLVSFFCNSLQGDQVLFGTSFVTPKCFGHKMLNNQLSLYRKNTYNKIDGEGQIIGLKYYIKNGILISAFNDIKSASYLSQTAGDTAIVADNLNTMLDFHNIYIDPQRQNVGPNLPVFDAIGGNQFYYNQITGELFMNLLSTSSGTTIFINEHLVDFFDRVECAVVFNNTSGMNTNDYGLLINFEKE